MDLFLSYSCDFLSQEFTRATLEDDADKLRRLNQAMERGNKIWESWVLSFGGSVVTLGFGVGILQVAADRLSEIAAVKSNVASAIGMDLSVGVGKKISEAEKSLKAAKLGGGDQIVLYDDQVEETLAEAEHRSKTEDAISNIFSKSEELAIYEQLMKGSPAQTSAQGPFDPGSEASISSSMSSPALQQGGGAGMAGAAQPAHPAAPMGEASEHSQGEAMGNMMENDNPGPAEGTHAADEDALHQVAEGQEKDDKDKDDAEAEGDAHIAAIKKQVVAVLEQVKQQAQILEQIKQQAPEVYKTIMGMVQAVILMAREMNKETPEDKPEGDTQDVQKSEIDWENIQFADPLEKSVKDVRLGEPLDIATLHPNNQKIWAARINNAAHYDYSHLLSPESKANGYRLILGMSEPGPHGVSINANIIHPEDSHCGGVSGLMRWSTAFDQPILRINFTQIHGQHQGKGFGRACYKALFAHAHNKLGIKRVAGGIHATGASKIHESVSRELGLNYKPTPNIGGVEGYSSKKAWDKEPGGDFDEKFRAYNYELKGEMPFNKDELVKMAKIHDDPKNPKVLWRVQNNRGLGPYNSNYSDPNRNKAMRLAYGRPAEDPYDNTRDLMGPRADAQPSPHSDSEYPYDERNLIGRLDEGTYFAFESPEHAENWFGKDALKRLGELGFPLVRVHGGQVWRSNSGKQVFFTPPTPGKPVPIEGGSTPAPKPIPVTVSKPTPHMGSHSIDKSEALAKAPIETPAKLADAYADRDITVDKKIFYHKETKKMRNGLYHHVYKLTDDKGAAYDQLAGMKVPAQDDSGRRMTSVFVNDAYDVFQKHVISADPRPFGVGLAEAEGHGARDERPEYQYFRAYGARVHPDHAGKGLGRLAAAAAMLYNGNKLTTADTDVSKKATASVKESMKDPNLSVKLGRVGTTEPHVVSAKDPEALAAQLYEPATKKAKTARKSEEAFDPDELAMGSEEELEHTDDPDEAAEIAKDHLREDPKYYSKLKAAGLVKAGPMPSTPKRRSHIIPGMQIPGAQKDCSADSTGKVGEAGIFVVKDAASGKNKKKQGLAGVIMGQSGPTSSLTPDG